MSYAQPQPFLPVVAGNWWTLALRGIVAVLFGLAALIWPGLTLGVLVLLLGAYLLVDGIFAAVAALRSSSAPAHRALLLLEGLAGVAAGLVALLWTGLAAVALLYVVAAWAIITGVTEVMSAIRLRREIRGEWAMGLSGILSVLFGVALAVLPAFGLLALAWLIGIYAIAFGALLMVLAFRVRGERDTGGGRVA